MGTSSLDRTANGCSESNHDDEGDKMKKENGNVPLHLHQSTSLKSCNDRQRILTIDEISKQLYSDAGLAPMVRASTIPLRTLAIQYGANFVYTEELIDRSIAGTVRVVNDTLGTIDYVKDSSRLSAKQLRRLGDVPPAVFLRIDRNIERGKLICQIGSGDAQLAVAAALHVHNDVDAIDINMGCPKKFSTSDGMGSALLSDPDRACRVIRTLADTMNPLGRPVSAKIRLLKQDNTSKESKVSIQGTVDFVSGLINAGASAVAIHGRRVGDPEMKAADWESLSEVVTLVKCKYPSTPILINGDFYTRSEFMQFQQQSGADGVLLARPALYNTSIFRKPSVIVDDHVMHDYNSPLLLDKTTVIQDYLRESIKYDVHYKNVKYVTCEMMNSRRAPIERVPYLPQIFSGGQTIGKTCSCNTLKEICQIWDINYDKMLQEYRQQQQQLLHPEQDTTIETMKMIQAPAGEHTYSDDYILQRQPEVVTGNTPSPPLTIIPDKTAKELGHKVKSLTRQRVDSIEQHQETNSVPSPKRLRVDSSI
jgi:tRNA-dihydrouridine synthase 2